MFDNTILKSKTTNTTINNFSSVSGTLVKSTKGSKIIRFHMTSKRADTFFDVENPHYVVTSTKYNDDKYYTSYEVNTEVPIEVLQVMLCNGDNYLVEYIELNHKED